MRITRAGAMASARGPAEWFAGTVRIDAPFKAEPPARVGGATVTFEPGARTHWHTHPLGQTLIVLSGLGRCQRDGGPVEEIRPGDIVWFAPGEKALEMGAAAIVPGAMDWIGLLVIAIVIPAVVSLLVSEFMRNKGWIKMGDYDLHL